MSVIAHTEYGQVRGVKQISAVDIEYVSFYGIPYATTPLGDLRFKDPTPPAKWSTIYDASEEKPGCFAADSTLKKVIGTEDCLKLNIYTKDVQPIKPYPVMFYIYGGAFCSGSSSTMLYGPDYLLLADIILVVCDYRLGPLGFTSFKDPSLNVPGNAGLKDQLAALKFVKYNIRNFGGDPNNITLFGHSAGAYSVNWHCSSEQSEGLFNRAILLSGSILHSFFNANQSENWPLRLAIKLGYTGNSEDKNVLEFLQTADPVRMAEEQNNIILPEERGIVKFVFSPTVEPYKTTNTFISKSPIDSCRTSWGNNIDILIGGTSDEGLGNLTFIEANPAIITSLNLNDAIPNNINFTDNNQRADFVERLHKLYYGSSEPTEDKTAYCKWQGDLVFLHGMHRLIQSRQNSNGKGQTYLYRFAVDSPTQNLFLIKRNRPNVRGVSHADEISYFFKNNYEPIPHRESMEFTAIQRFVSLLTSFATTGNPNDNILKADLQNVRWDPVSSKKPPFMCLNINENLEFKIHPETERLLFWDDLYTKTNTPLY